MADRVSQPQTKAKGKIRNRAISGELFNNLSAVGDELDVYFEVGSGGQTSSRDPKLYKKAGGWTGSHRHDDGEAADVMAYRIDGDGNKVYLDWSDPDDQKIWSEIVRLAVSNGAVGVGAGKGYMGTKTVHLGGGSSAVWGTVKKGGPAPPKWIKDAHKAGLTTPPMSIPNATAPNPMPFPPFRAARDPGQALADARRQDFSMQAFMSNGYTPSASVQRALASERRADPLVFSGRVPEILPAAENDNGGTEFINAAMYGVPDMGNAAFAPVAPGMTAPIDDMAAAFMAGADDKLMALAGSTSGAVVSKDKAEKKPAAKADEPKEYAKLPSGRMIEVGPQRNSKGERIIVSKGENGEAVIRKGFDAGFLTEEGTVLSGIVKTEVDKVVTQAAKEGIGKVSETIGDIAPKVTGALDTAKKGVGGFFGGLMEYVGDRNGRPIFTVSGEPVIDRAPIPVSAVAAYLYSPKPIATGAALSFKLPTTLGAALAGTSYETFAPTMDNHFSGKVVGGLKTDQPTKEEQKAPAVQPPSLSIVKPPQGGVRKAETVTVRPSGEQRKAAPAGIATMPLDAVPSLGGRGGYEKPGEGAGSWDAFRRAISPSVSATPVPAPRVGKVAPTPAPARPRSVTETVVNPAYEAWMKQYGMKPTAAVTETKTRAEQMEMRNRGASASPTPPVVPPPPSRTVTRTRTLAPVPHARPLPQQAAAQGGNYTIRKGDTLSAIAKANGVSVEALRRANPHITDPNKIYAGGSLSVPKQRGTTVANPTTKSSGSSSPPSETSSTSKAPVYINTRGQEVKPVTIQVYDADTGTWGSRTVYR